MELDNGVGATIGYDNLIYRSMPNQHREFRTTTTIQQFEATIPLNCVKSKVPQKYGDSCALLPFSWDFLLTIYEELAKLIYRLPFKKRLVICLVFRGSKFRLDLGEGECKDACACTHLRKHLVLCMCIVCR